MASVGSRYSAKLSLHGDKPTWWRETCALEITPIKYAAVEQTGGTVGPGRTTRKFGDMMNRKVTVNGLPLPSSLIDLIEARPVVCSG